MVSAVFTADSIRGFRCAAVEWQADMGGGAAGRDGDYGLDYLLPGVFRHRAADDRSGNDVRVWSD